MGGYPILSNWGVPPSLLIRGTPILSVPLSDWWGGGGYLGILPVRTGWDKLPVGAEWGYPLRQETEEQSEHLLRGGRYASYVHAVGLSFLSVYGWRSDTLYIFFNDLRSDTLYFLLYGWRSNTLYFFLYDWRSDTLYFLLYGWRLCTLYFLMYDWRSDTLYFLLYGCRSDTLYFLLYDWRSDTLYFLLYGWRSDTLYFFSARLAIRHPVLFSVRLEIRYPILFSVRLAIRYLVLSVWLV